MSETPAFTPRSISGGNLKLWLDATVGVVPGSTFTWTDQSGKGNDATQSSGANQPTAGVSAAWGNRRVLSFDSAAPQYLAANGLGTLLSGDHLPVSFFAAIRRGSPSVNITPISWDGAIGVTNFFRTSLEPTAGAVVCATHDKNGGDPDVQVQTAQVTDTSPHILSVVFTGSVISIYLDGAATSVANAAFNSADATITTTCTIGAERSFGSPGTFLFGWLGDIGEITVYDRALSDVERVQLGAYLRGKWGTP